MKQQLNFSRGSFRSTTLIAAVMGLASVTLSLSAQAQSKQKPSKKFKVMSYNVQNLFDTKDDPKTNDQDFLPNGTDKWTEVVLADKIANLAAVIKAEDADVVGLSEVENQEVLTQLLVQGKLREAGYQVALAGPSDDGRGIRNAILSKYPLVSTRSHRVWKDSWRSPKGDVQKTRDIFEATVDFTGALSANAENMPSRSRRDFFVDDYLLSRGFAKTFNKKKDPSAMVTFLINHWPSRAGGPERDAMRLEVAQRKAEITEEILEANPARLLVSVGDFNDELQDASFQKGLTLVKNMSELATARQNAFYALDSELEHLSAEQKGTFYFKRDKVWNALDHVLVAKGQAMHNSQRGFFDYKAGSIKIVRPREFMVKGLFPSGCEMGDAGRTADRCLAGASDHLGMTAEFEYR